MQRDLCIKHKTKTNTNIPEFTETILYIQEKRRESERRREEAEERKQKEKERKEREAEEKRRTREAEQRRKEKVLVGLRFHKASTSG